MSIPANENMTLKDAIEQTLDKMRQQGYSEKTIHTMRLDYNRLIRIAVSLHTEYVTDEAVNTFLADTISSRTGEYSLTRDQRNKRCIIMLKSFLETGTPQMIYKRGGHQFNIAPDFYKALQEYDSVEDQSDLIKSSKVRNRRPIMYLLEYMTNLGYTKLSDIKPGDTNLAIQDMLENHYSPSSFATAISGLRRFYSMFGELEKYKLEIPSKIRRGRNIIKVLTKKEEDRLRKILDSDSICMRDKAICTLILETGLRGSDVSNLKLENIDWETSTINIIQSKTQRPLRLPLQPSYGNKIVYYLLKERPKVESEYVFLTKKAPFRKVISINGIITRILKAAEIERNTREFGPRLLRHNLASSMVKNGVKLEYIKESLGHKSADSTLVYISTDQPKLAALTLPLP